MTKSSIGKHVSYQGRMTGNYQGAYASALCHHLMSGIPKFSVLILHTLSLTHCSFLFLLYL